MVNFFEKKEPTSDAPKHPSFKSYVDPTHELDSKELARDIWFVRHEVFLYRLFLWSAIIVAVVSWGYTLFNLGDYLIFGITKDRILAQQAARFINYTPLKSAYAPAPLDNPGIYFLQSGTNKADAVAEITNPNTRWLTTFTYHFDVGLASSTEFNAALAPGQTTFLTSLGLEAGANDPSLIISNQKWRRVSNHEVPDAIKFTEEHFNFEVKDFVFSPAGTDTSAPSAARITFTFTNQSPYSYSHPTFIIGLYRNQALVGVIPLKLEAFRSLESVPVDVRSFTPNLNVDSVTVYPTFNIFDPESYITPGQ